VASVENPQQRRMLNIVLQGISNHRRATKSVVLPLLNEKPEIQQYLEGRGHVCMFCLKFHCEINPIEMLWGYMKYCELSCLTDIIPLIIFHLTGFCTASDGKFAMAKVLVPQCLDMVDTLIIQCFFWKAWHYMDTYQCSLLIRPFSIETLAREEKVSMHARLPLL
jgi:hypothetical protein